MRAVTSLTTGDPVVLPDRPTRLRAGIRNFGPTNLAGLRVELYVDGYLAAFKTADVRRREETVVEFPHEFHAAGEHAVESADSSPTACRPTTNAGSACRSRRE